MPTPYDAGGAFKARPVDFLQHSPDSIFLVLKTSIADLEPSARLNPNRGLGQRTLRSLFTKVVPGQVTVSRSNTFT